MDKESAAEPRCGGQCRGGGDPARSRNDPRRAGARHRRRTSAAMASCHFPARERRALAVLLALGLAGHLLRAVAAQPAPPPVAATLFDPAADGDPIAHRDSIRAPGPAAGRQRTDRRRPGRRAEELNRLPGVGPALARRIVADREKAVGRSAARRPRRGHAGSGPALLSRLAGHLSFGGVPAEAQGVDHPGTVPTSTGRRWRELDALPGIGPAQGTGDRRISRQRRPISRTGRPPASARHQPGWSARLTGRVTIH